MFDAQFIVSPALVLIPLAVAAAVAGGRRLRPRNGRQRLALAAAVAYVVAVADVTFFPMEVALGRYGNQAAWHSQINPIPLLTLDARTFVLNIVMTIPLGVLLALLVPRVGLRDVAIVGVLFSLSIEVTQLALNVLASTGRGADVNDLIANTLGALLGYVVYRTVRPARV